MGIEEHVSLAACTTLNVGGEARYAVSVTTYEELQHALSFAHEHELPWAVLGEGSNVLAADTGFPGVLIRMRIPGISFQEEDDTVRVVAGAGVSWDALVRACAQQGLWGIENLAGIPGTVGAAPVQNIGAYGVELRSTLEEVEALNTETNTLIRYGNEECAFGYRESRFKHEPELIICSVTLRLTKAGAARTDYADIARAVTAGSDVATPEAVGKVVRSIRAQKFPDLHEYGTAGSFFKNPVITEEQYAALHATYPDMPSYPALGGVKIPLAFVLDKVLGLRGYREGTVALFEKQPLVLVATNATAEEIDTFANHVAQKVFDATHITIEREVQPFPKKF